MAAILWYLYMRRTMVGGNGCDGQSSRPKGASNQQLFSGLITTVDNWFVTNSSETELSKAERDGPDNENHHACQSIATI